MLCFIRFSTVFRNPVYSYCRPLAHNAKISSCSLWETFRYILLFDFVS